MPKTKAGLECSLSESSHEAASYYYVIFAHFKAQEVWYFKEHSQEEKTALQSALQVTNSVILSFMISILIFKLYQDTSSSAIPTEAADERPLKSLAEAANEVSFPKSFLS